MNVQNALAATAAAWAAGAHLHDIRQGLRTFTTSYFMAPGRLNMFELDGYRVIVDYAHNPPAVQALGEFVDALAEPTPRRAPAAGQRPAHRGRRHRRRPARRGHSRDRCSRRALLRRDHRPRGREHRAAASRGRRRRSSRRASARRWRPARAAGPSRSSSTRSRPPAARSTWGPRATWWSSASIARTRCGRSCSAASMARSSAIAGPILGRRRRRCAPRRLGEPLKRGRTGRSAASASRIPRRARRGS